MGRIAAANPYADRHGRRGFVASQVQWSLAEPEWPAGPDPVMRHVTAEDAAWYAAAGIPVMAYTATAGGYFAREPAGGAFDSPDNRARRARAHEMAGRLGCTPTQVALAYLLHRPAPVIPLFSTSNPAHLAEAVAALDVELSEADVAWLRGQ